MAKSESALALDRLQKRLSTNFKARSFRKRARTYNRVTAEGLTQVVNFQMGAFAPPGAEDLPGYRENLYGYFAVNFGIHVPEVARCLEMEAGSVVNEYDCQLRARLSEGAGPGGADLWWKVSDEDDVVEDIRERLEVDVFPRLDAMSTRRGVLQGWPGVAERFYTDASNPWALVAAILLAGQGEPAAARRLLEERAATRKSARSVEFVHELARKLDVPLGPG